MGRLARGLEMCIYGLRHIWEQSGDSYWLFVNTTYLYLLKTGILLSCYLSGILFRLDWMAKLPRLVGFSKYL
jgi:hypothetical protein